MLTIDINCDVGEGVGNESKLLPLISSCNIACGGHAGDEETMANTIILAKKHCVKIGAHPSYPDKENFGRKVLTISESKLKKSLKQQLELFQKIIKANNANLHHIKAHGALYNQSAIDKDLANLFLEVVQDFGNYPIYVPFNSAIEKLALEINYPIIYEAFADRNYDGNLKLVSRNQNNSLIEEPKAVLEHIKRMCLERKVKTIDGQLLPIKAETFCIHGDTPSAFKILTYLHNQLPNQQLKILK
ncbi:UPF0271 protein [Croceivirga lutea]|uniref:5-oxoprolinase subunit PxpA n=1 Tax=Croceivirga lutea TaxID=1775167 RepID=UPI00163B1D17|nr:5-oxoprolinase subunit PxpA [Croceivirga lutea]GGG46226.1 UPF0271 protein [Croceivirga lutea]